MTEHPVLTPLAITGLQATPWALGLIALLLGFGGVMFAFWRREREAA
ncbi:hypothetical protein HD600_001928 [Microbacterium ginsengiterrae]|uniref:Uncharacterized protein n=1 Tax=Microbacterium ginsengiterrae TaxID=546115 RepID=A0A7W9CD81_9MICO|nr:hypothetical protein [Microbacterium ginsengiterrae]MBB5743431.1 hypothetical protein [Microbacterium ginsengiterrae]